MATTHDQLWDFGQALSHLLEMDDVAFHAALAEGFKQHRPPYLENLSNEQWAVALFEWLGSAIPTIQERIELPVEHTTALVEVHNLTVTFDTDTTA